MVAASNCVNSVQHEQPSIGYNPHAIRAGMKLTETYKEESLFGKFRLADVDEDGVISEKEYELYEKKENLNEEYMKEFNNAHKFNTKKHGIPLGIAGLLGASSFVVHSAAASAFSPFLAAVGAVAAPVLAVLAVGAVCYTVANIIKTDKELDNKKSLLDEKIKKLDDDYDKKMK